MWIFSSKENEWINIEYCSRLFRDGREGWAFMMRDGQAVHLTDEEYENAMRWVDPDYYKKHPDSDRHPDFDIKKEFDELKAAVLKKKED